jgi:hypothetical protein
MKRASSVLLVTLFALSLLGAPRGAHLRNRTDAGQNASAKRQEAEAPSNATEEMVPVLVIVDDTAANQSSAPPPGMSQACAKEMFTLRMNESRFKSAKACEESTGYMNHTLEALRHADEHAALTAATAFHQECAGLSPTCAKEVAPHVVMNFRLSGLTISEVCGEAGKKSTEAEAKGKPSEKKPCQENTTKAMVKGLRSKDMEATLDAAEHGLASCAGIEHPCDFQLAPVLVMQLVQAIQVQEEAQIAEVLFAKLRASADTEAGAKAAGAPAKAAQKLDKAAKIKFSPPKFEVPWKMQRAAHSMMRRNDPRTSILSHPRRNVPRGLSLLDVNEHVQITFRRRTH